MKEVLNKSFQTSDEDLTTTEGSPFDLDYIVNRPEEDSDEDDGDDDSDEEDDDDDDDDELPLCGDDHGGEGLAGCSDGIGDLTPYKKYKGYKKWTRRPLLVIIIGG